MHMNKYIIRNINLLSNCEKFSEEFTEMIILSLLNFFSDYNQIKLYSDSQNIIIFMIFLELLHQITFLIRMMNLLTQFSQKIIQILKFNILHNIKIFINNINIKKLKTKYNNEKSFSKIQHFMLKHLQTLDCIFLTLKLINVKIFKEKSHFDQSEIIIVRFSCNYDKRHSEAAKIIKIVNWSSC